MGKMLEYAIIYINCTVKIQKFGTANIVTEIVVRVEQLNLTMLMDGRTTLRIATMDPFR